MDVSKGGRLFNAVVECHFVWQNLADCWRGSKKEIYVVFLKINFTIYIIYRGITNFCIGLWWGLIRLRGDLKQVRFEVVLCCAGIWEGSEYIWMWGLRCSCFLFVLSIIKHHMRPIKCKIFNFGQCGVYDGGLGIGVLYFLVCLFS